MCFTQQFVFGSVIILTQLTCLAVSAKDQTQLTRPTMVCFWSDSAGPHCGVCFWSDSASEHLLIKGNKNCKFHGPCLPLAKAKIYAILKNLLYTLSSSSQTIGIIMSNESSTNTVEIIYTPFSLVNIKQTNYVWL